MSATTLKSTEHETASIADRVAQGTEKAMHLSHEAHAAKSFAEDAIEDRVHAARRWVEKTRRRSIEMLEDLKDEGAHYVKRQPLKTVALASGVALTIGMATGWIAARLISSRERSDDRAS
jgi:ElaB/YqjD/DUF883 family membrane-anchored ribosome-binding protein